jgi:hypothetical protein
VSGFENYGGELSELDREITHYAAICGVDLADHAAIHACINASHQDWPADKARETLRGLLVLRIKVETEMIEQGMTPGELKGW